MGKKRKKKSKKLKMPPLGALDRCIYWLGFILITLVLVALAWGYVGIREHLTRYDPAEIASVPHLSILWASPAAVCLLLTLYLSWGGLYSKRYPFFGKRGIVYGPTKYPPVYPLFQKNKPDYWKSPSKRRGRRAIAMLILVVNLLCLALVPLSIHGRDALLRDGDVVEYNLLGSKHHDTEARDVTVVTVSVYYRGSRYHRGWALGVKLTNRDGKSYSFEPSDCYADGLKTLAEVLAQYDQAKFTFRGQENAPLLAEDWNLDEQEREYLSQILGLQ